MLKVYGALDKDRWSGDIGVWINELHMVCRTCSFLCVCHSMEDACCDTKRKKVEQDISFLVAQHTSIIAQYWTLPNVSYLWDFVYSDKCVNHFSLHCVVLSLCKIVKQNVIIAYKPMEKA